MPKSCKEFFGERLKELRVENGMSQDNLSKELNVSQSALGYYENCGRTPDIEFLEKVSKYFNVSDDYLLGHSQARTVETEIKTICDYTGLSEKSIDFLHALVEKNKDKESYEYIFEAISLLFSSGESSKDFIKNLIGYIYSAYGNDFFRRKFENEDVKKIGGIHVPADVLDQNTLHDIEYFLLSLKMSRRIAPTGYFYYYYYDNEPQEGDENNA